MSQDPTQPIVPTPVPVEVKPIAAQPPAPGTVEPTFPASHVHELREEAAGWRKKFREAEERIKTLEPFEKKVPELQGQVRGYKVDGAVSEAITKAGLNAKLTKAVIRDEIGQLDPDQPDFSKSLSALIKKAGEDNPELKVQATGAPASPARAGSDITHPGTVTPVNNDQWTRADLARAKAEGPKGDEAIATALKEGKLKAIMGGQA